MSPNADEKRNVPEDALDREADLREKLDYERALRERMSTRDRRRDEEEQRKRGPKRVGEFLKHPDTGRIYFRRF